ncbi:hypothetical protein MCG98_00630 [Ruminococcus sp. OA3]|uniref:hypothetical protein n=1 Tax=Ruminococcus sp. OA3 TaxID=2914164 RepID=UPI001F061121|nr:hypothetical protein [Ruminococcus sp. OA3]MCH1981079.1 hypothetical protein [Ruminococcus sp. OA3]
MKNRATGNKWITVAVAALAVAAVLCVIWFFRQGKPYGDSGVADRGLVIADDASAWTQNLEDRSEGEPGIKIPGYGELTISENAESFSMSLVNPENNPCYFKYTLEVAGTSDVLYESDLIEPGKAVTRFEVANLPDAGDYDLHINISTYSMDDEMTSMNGAQVKTVLHVV